MVSVPEVDLPSDSPARRALVVAGMHRSGTSAMARTLSLLGAVLPKHLMEVQADNPVGFWESPKIADFNDEILSALDSEWDDVFSFRPRPYLSNFDRVFAGRAVELLEGEFNGAELIAFKDPRVSVLTAFWERALREAGYSTTYVIMVRNPLEVAESLRTRNSFPRDKSLLLWSSYMTAVERDTRGLSRTFISYDDLMRDWRKVIARVEAAAGVPFPRDTPAARNDIDAFLDRGLRHYSTGADELASRGDVPDYVSALYALFQAACRGADLDVDAIDAVQTELTKIEASVGSLVADLRARARSLASELAESRQAERGAVEQSRALSEELAEQRQQLAEELARQQRQLADLEAAAVEREQASAELAAHRQQIADLQAAIESEQSAANEAREALHQRIAELTHDVQQRDAAVAEAQAKLEEQATIEAKLNARIAALSDELLEKDASVLQAQEALDRTLEEKRTVNARLEERFGEIASLTRLLAEAEAREEQARAEADWLRETGAVLLNGSTGRKRRGLRALLPASFHGRRVRRLLKDLGLFDEEAYLASNPDVAAAGMDPLHHYLQHGIHEQRRV